MSTYLTPAKLCDEFSVSRTTVYRRMDGIKDEIESGRYGAYAIVGSRVHKAVFLDYMKYEEELKGTTRRFVPPFDVKEAMRYLEG